MDRKKRRVPQQFQPLTPDNKPKKIYRDEFQSNVGKKVEEISRKVEGGGRNLLYGLAAVAVLAALVGMFYAYNRRSNAAAQTALGKAIETSQAQVTSSPAPAGSSPAKTFKTEKERAEASINEFQTVADKYGSSVADKAKYFIAVNKISLDRAVAVSELEGLSKTGGEVGTLSKFALAQAKAGDGKLDEAAALYQELAALDNPIVSKDTLNFNRAQIFEKLGKKDEAAELYFNIAKAASEAKDSEGKAIVMTQTARDAKQKLEAINPEKAKEIKEAEPDSPLGNVNLGM